ncbi:hypothetical protein J2W96_005244 [Variovorax guangxiensis]|nr:hypothetical protein [Variovorax guangxiensis]
MPSDDEEFEILLCTGGPTVRIVGDLDHHGEPDRARIEYQDWFEPWREAHAFPLTARNSAYSPSHMVFRRGPAYYFFTRRPHQVLPPTPFNGAPI